MLGGDIEHAKLTCVRSHSDRPRPASGHEGKTSNQYVFAAAVLDGKVDVRTFEDQRRWAPDMVSMLDKITLEVDDTVGGSWEQSYCVAEVRLSDGSVHVARCDAPAGSWGGPAIEPGAHLEKIRTCLGSRLPSDSVDEIISLVAKLESLDHIGVKRLVSLVGLITPS